MKCAISIKHHSVKFSFCADVAYCMAPPIRACVCACSFSIFPDFIFFLFIIGKFFLFHWQISVSNLTSDIIICTNIQQSERKQKKCESDKLYENEARKKDNIS